MIKIICQNTLDSTKIELKTRFHMVKDFEIFIVDLFIEILEPSFYKLHI